MHVGIGMKTMLHRVSLILGVAVLLQLIIVVHFELSTKKGVYLARMCPSLIFSVGPFSVSICSVIGASPSILAPVFVLLGSFVDVVAAIFGGSCVCITQFIC